MTRLFPCPFCGSTKVGTIYWGGHTVECDTCGANGPMVRESQPDAVLCWNRRVSLDRATKDFLAEKAAEISDLAETLRDASK